jgi:hypothetical protein
MFPLKRCHCFSFQIMLKLESCDVDSVELLYKCFLLFRTRKKQSANADTAAKSSKQEIIETEISSEKDFVDKVIHTHWDILESAVREPAFKWVLEQRWSRPLKSTYYAFYCCLNCICLIINPPCQRRQNFSTLRQNQKEAITSTRG